MMSVFRPTSRLNVQTADLTMFRFNGTHEFNLQCKIIECAGRCPQPNCFSIRTTSDQSDFEDASTDTNLINAGSISQRIFVSDVPPKMDHIRKPCVWSQDWSLIGVSLLLATLIFLTTATCASAIKNRPWRCHLDVRDNQSNHQRFSRLCEEAASIRNRQTLPKLSTSDSSKRIREMSEHETITQKSVTSTISAYDEGPHYKIDTQLIKQMEKPLCCETGKSMDELPQAPVPKISRNLDHSMENSLKKLKSMLPPPSEEDISCSSYQQSINQESTPSDQSGDQNLYETPSGCMLSTLF